MSLLDVIKDDKVFIAFETIITKYNDLGKQLAEVTKEKQKLKDELDRLDLCGTCKCRKSIASTPLKSVNNCEGPLDSKYYLDDTADLDEFSITSSPLRYPKNPLRRRTTPETYANKENRAIPCNAKVKLKSKSTAILSELNTSLSGDEQKYSSGWLSKSNSDMKTKSPLPKGKKFADIKTVFDDADNESEIMRTPSVLTLQDHKLNKKRSILSLGKSPILKQRKLNFQKVSKVLKIENHQDEETYCEGLTATINATSLFSDGEDNQLETSNDSKINRVPIKTSPKSVKDYDSSVFAISTDTDEIILINESQTQDLFNNIIGNIEDETKYEEEVLEPKRKNVKDSPVEIKKPSISPVRYQKPQTSPVPYGCAECENWHRIMDGDGPPLEYRKKQHMCRNQKREYGRAVTPPNFWNPKIAETPEDEKILTPFDYRFTKIN